MNINKIVEFLTAFNAWRRGDDTIKQPDSIEVGIAIDEAIKAMHELAALRDDNAQISENALEQMNARHEANARAAKFEAELAALRADKERLVEFKQYVQKFGDYWKSFNRAAIDAARKEVRP